MKGPFKHGHSCRLIDGRKGASPEYRAYQAMKNRCLNKKQARFKDYGQRGITISDRWLNGDGERCGFECFLLDVGRKPSGAHTLERVRNEEGYAPGNVKWATRVEQARNTRATKYVVVRGIRCSLAEAVEQFGAVSYHTANRRLGMGWTPDEAVTLPKGARPTIRFHQPAKQAQQEQING